MRADRMGDALPGSQWDNLIEAVHRRDGRVDEGGGLEIL